MIVDIQHLIDRLEEMVAESRRLPIGGSLMLDRVRLLDLIDQMRASVPTEVRDARQVLQRRDEIIAAARMEAKRMVEQAQQEATTLVQGHEVTRAAERHAGEIIRQAQERAAQILQEAEERAQTRLRLAEQAATEQMNEADRYALELLRRLEAQLHTFLASIHRGIESFEEPRTDEHHPG